MLKSLFHGLVLSVLVVAGFLFTPSPPVKAAEGYSLITKIFFPVQDIGDPFYTDFDKNNDIVENNDFDASGGDVGYTDTDGVGYNCSDTETDDFGGPLCEGYFVKTQVLEGGVVAFENVLKYMDEAGGQVLTIYYDGDQFLEQNPIGQREVDVADNAQTGETIEDIADQDQQTLEEREAEETDEEDDSCEENGGVLGFIMCAAVEGFDALLGLIDRIIISQLTIDPDRYNNDEMRTAAGVVRNISYVIMVPILLVMVIGTALNFNFLDAYTVKRAMPRMLVAIIFITLSWPLLTLLVEATEVIAAGLNGIITSPFREGGGDLSMQEIFGPGLLTSVASAVVAGVGLVILLVLFGGTLAGMAAIGFVILLARQIFIVALMLVAPLAMVSWIFPGNDKLWKAWWGTFSKLLLMYPLIIGILAMGRVFAKIIHPSADSDIGNVGSEEIIEPVAAFIVYFLPYAFIPFAFKTAGGIFGQVTGALNDRSKGFFDKQREKRGGRLKRMQNQGPFKKYNDDDKRFRARAARFGNKTAGIYTNNPLDSAALMSGGKIPGLKNRGARIGSQITGAAYQDTQEMFKALQEQGLTVDQAFRVLTGTHKLLNTEELKNEGFDFSKGITSQKELNKAIDVLSKSKNNNDRVAAAQLAQASQFVLAGHKDEKYGRGNLQGAALMGLASQGFADNEDIATVAKNISNGGENATLAGLIANQASYMTYSKGRLDAKPTYGVQALFDEKGNLTFSEMPDYETQKQLVANSKQHDFVQLKGAKPVKELSRAMIDVVQNAERDVERTEIDPVTGNETTVKVKGPDGKVLREADPELRQAMLQNIATSALSSTDAGAKAEWRKVFAKAKGIEDSSSPQVDLELRRTMYGDINPNSPEGRQIEELMRRQQELDGSSESESFH